MEPYVDERTGMSAGPVRNARSVCPLAVRRKYCAHGRSSLPVHGSPKSFKVDGQGVRNPLRWGCRREREREGSGCIAIFIENYVGVSLKRRAEDTRALYVFADADGQESSFREAEPHKTYRAT